MCCYNSETVQLLCTLHWAAFQKNVEIALSITVISPYIDELDFIKLIIDYILFFTLYCCVVNIKLHLILPRLAHNNHITSIQLYFWWEPHQPCHGVMEQQASLSLCMLFLWHQQQQEAEHYTLPSCFQVFWAHPFSINCSKTCWWKSMTFHIPSQ